LMVHVEEEAAPLDRFRCARRDAVPHACAFFDDVANGGQEGDAWHRGQGNRRARRWAIVPTHLRDELFEPLTFMRPTVPADDPIHQATEGAVVRFRVVPKIPDGELKVLRPPGMQFSVGVSADAPGGMRGLQPTLIATRFLALSDLALRNQL
jgi:hypothetical protein